MRVNISVDSLEAGKFSRLTGGGSLPKVLAAIDACLAVGSDAAKIERRHHGRGINDDEIQALVGLTRLRPLSVRFIELMPLNGWAAIRTARSAAAISWPGCPICSLCPGRIRVRRPSCSRCPDMPGQSGSSGRFRIVSAAAATGSGSRPTACSSLAWAMIGRYH